MSNRIKRIAIVGLGLIGGSLAMALKINGYQVVGISKKEETLLYAKNANVIEEGFTEINSNVLNNVDIIFLATPLSLIFEYIEKLRKIVKKEIILTDVGSTKVEICNFAKEKLPENITFIGGHPMAGTEKAGFLSAQLGLFKNCPWILTPHDESSKIKNALNILENLIIQIGAVPIITNAEEHDMLVALVSHLPLLASLGLCQMVQKTKSDSLKKLATMIASSGFRDTTRIAGANPNLSSDLISSNHKKLSQILPSYISELQSLLELALKDKKDFLKNISVLSEWRKDLYNSEGKNKYLTR